MYKFFIKVNGSILEVDKDTYHNYIGEKTLFEFFNDRRNLYVLNKDYSESRSFTAFEISKANQLLPVWNFSRRPDWKLAEEMLGFIKKNYNSF